MDFLLEITKIWQKSLETFGSRIFFLRCLKSITVGWYTFSYWFLVVLNLFQPCFVITNFKFDKHCFVKDYLWKHICIIAWCPVRQRNLQASPYGFKNLYPSKKPRLWLDSWLDFRQHYLCDFHTCSMSWSPSSLVARSAIVLFLTSSSTILKKKDILSSPTKKTGSNIITRFTSTTPPPPR